MFGPRRPSDEGGAPQASPIANGCPKSQKPYANPIQNLRVFPTTFSNLELTFGE